MMAGSTFSPIYWRRVQSGLVDFVRQLGFPKLFFTLAPSEWTLPCHAFVLDGMTKLLRARLRLPVEETLHVTHTLLQTAKGFLLGHTGARQEWKDHLLAVRDKTGRSRKLHGFVRIEFQDGTRRLATQEYHGSGRPHLHLLVFGDDDLVRTLDMPHLASATMPADEDLAGYVRGSQLDHRQDSGRAVFEEETQFLEATGAWKLRHTRADKAVGLRAYFPDVLDALKCHQDLLIGEDKAGMLRQYITKYLAKFSNSASQEWLNDDAGATSIATTVLSRYHPLEPEMILQLFGARLRQWHFTTVSGGKRDFVVPVPDADEPENHEVRLYERAAWARGRVSLLDFLRKTNTDGEVCAWLKKKHAAQGREGEALGEFAARYEMEGKKVVAADLVSRLICGRSPACQGPNPASLLDHGLPERLRARPGGSRPRVEGRGPRPRRSAKHQGHAGGEQGPYRGLLVGQDLAADTPSPTAGQAAGRAAAGRAATYNSQQTKFRALLDAAVSQAVRGRSEDAAAAEEAAASARAEAKALACLGPPGTGKTTVCHDKIEDLLAGAALGLRLTRATQRLA